MKTKNLALLLVSMINLFASAQTWVDKMQSPTANLYEIQAEFESYWLNRDRTEKGKGYKVFKRWEHFVEPRVYPSGDLSLLNLTAQNYQSWYASYTTTPGKKKQTGNVNQLASASFTAIGPMNAMTGSAGGQLLKSGRLNFITIDPTNPNNLWVGAPAGGLWKSTNNGVSWTTNTNFLPLTGCSDLAIDPTNTSIMYLATGDGDAGDNPSIGVLKSTNGGTSWVATGLTANMSAGFRIRRIIINPSNTQILLAATSAGIYRTTNGGANWTLVNTNNCYDLEFMPGNPTVVYSGGTAFRLSTDGGVTFTTMSNGIAFSGVQRMAIAVTPADANYVYVLASDGTSSGVLGVYRSVNSGNAFTMMTGTTPNLLGWNANGSDVGGQGWYDLCIAASPLNRDEVVTGGVNVWRSTNGGTTWSIYGHWTGNVAAFTHADHHDLEYNSAGVLYNTNDGTVYRRGATNWVEISAGMNISQIYRLGMSSLTPNLWITGHQDNGTSIYNGTNYVAELGGDGMDCFIDRTNNQNVFGEYQYGSLMKSTNGGVNWSGCTNGLPNVNGPWLTVWKQDPVVANRLYCGYTQLYVSNDLATTWTQLAALPGTGDVREFAIAKSNNQFIYVLRGNGVYKSTNGGTSWTTITSILPTANARPEYIAIDPLDANNVWVVCSGYSAGNKVFVTTNGGTSWSNISTNLPNIPANCIVYQPGTNDRIYIGMDIGIYYRDAFTANWTLYNQDLPNVPVSELEISPASPTLLHVATYGRGVWVASTITNAALPISSFASGNSAKCAGSAITFSNTSQNAPTSYTWSVLPNTGIFINSPSVANPTVTFSNAGTYVVSLKTSNTAGSGNTFTQSVIVTALPTATITASSPSMCVGNSLTLTASGAVSYLWNNASTSAALVISPTVALQQVFTTTATSNGCSVVRTISIPVGPAVSMNITAPTVICDGSTVTISANAVGATSYTWNDNTTGPALSVSPSTLTVYSVTAQIYPGCLAMNTATIAVNPLPVLNVTANQSHICAGEVFTLSAMGAISYTWIPDFVNGDWNVYQAGQSDTYTVIGEDVHGCVSEKTMLVEIDACTGIMESVTFSDVTVSVYPNPAKSTVSLHAAGYNGEIVMQIIDMSGKLVQVKTIRFDAAGTYNELDVSTLATGAYFMQLKTDKGISRPVRLIKE